MRDLILKVIVVMWIFMLGFTLGMRKGSCSEINVEKLADSIKRAENSDNHPYGILRDYCKAGDPNGQCRKGCIQTINKRYRMWNKKGDFIEYLSRSYCPIGAENDSKGLNKNWVKNVTYYYNKGV